MREGNGTSAHPQRPEFFPHQIPRELRRLPRWISWFLDDNGRKVPRGSLLDPTLPRPFDEVTGPRIGFAFLGPLRDKDGRQLLAFDLDACRDPASERLAPWVERIREHYAQTYWEVTPSGAGLRFWLWVAEMPAFPLRTNYVRETAWPEGTDKTAQIQVFGQGSAGYVTVTGCRLPGSPPSVLVVENLDWIVDEFDFEQVHDARKLEELPVGAVEDRLTVDEIHEALQKLPDGPELYSGDWKALGYPSASEAYHRLVGAVITIARGHGQSVVDALLALPSWGQGRIDSKEPERYMSETWVHRDVCRVLAKTNYVNPREVFEPVLNDQPAIDQAEPNALLRTVHAAEARDELAADPDLWLVYQTMPRQGLVQLFGDPGAAKTPVAMSLAVHVAEASAKEWWGRDIDRHGTVVYMAGEGFAGLTNRLEATCEALGTRLDDIPLYLTREPGQLIDAADVASWIKDLHGVVERERKRTGKRSPIRMFVVDTQAQNFGAGNENASDDMNRFVQNLQTIARVFRTCVVLVHHSGHEHKGRGRGSSVMFAALDGCYEVRRAGRQVTLIFRKLKEGPLDEPFVGTLETIPVGVDRRGREVTTVRLRTSEPTPGEIFSDERTDDAQSVLRAIRELAGEPTTLREIAEESGLSLRIMRGHLDRLLELGVVAKVEGGPRSRRSVFQITEKGRIAMTPFDDESAEPTIEDLLS